MRDVVGIEIRGKLRDIECSTRVKLNNRFWKPKLSRTDPKGAELKPKQMQGEGLKAWEAEQGERPHGDEQKDQEHGPSVHQCRVCKRRYAIAPKAGFHDQHIQQWQQWMQRRDENYGQNTMMSPT